MIASLILHGGTCAGLIVVTYKAARALKHRVDVELDEETGREEEEAAAAAARARPQRPAPKPLAPRAALQQSLRRRQSAAPESVADVLFMSPGRKSLVGRRCRFSTALDRRSGADEAAEVASRLLRFWVLFAMLHLGAALGVPYAVELRAVLVLLATLREQDGGPLIERAFAVAARPALGRFAPRAARFLLAYLHFVVDAAAPVLRALLALAAHACAPFASTAALLALENGLQQASVELAAERALRRSIELRGGGGGGGGAASAGAGAGAGPDAADGAGASDEGVFEPADGDFLDDDELQSRAAAAPAGASVRERVSLGGGGARAGRR